MTPRRYTLLAAALLAATSAASIAYATPATKPLGFRNTVLDPQGSYGETSLALTKDGKHIAVCVPGGSGTYVWYSHDDGHTFGKSKTEADNGGGDRGLHFLPDRPLLNAGLEGFDHNLKKIQDFRQTWD